MMTPEHEQAMPGFRTSRLPQGWPSALVSTTPHLLSATFVLGAAWPLSRAQPDDTLAKQGVKANVLFFDRNRKRRLEGGHYDLIQSRNGYATKAPEMLVVFVG